MCSDSSDVGNPTEMALKKAVERYALRMKESVQVLDEIPFDSTRKRMSVVVRRGDKQELYCKGAPDILLERCRFVLTEQGKRPLTPAERQKINLALESMADQALRVIALAQGEPKTGERDLCFIGLAGMIDPPRPQVADAVELSEKQGFVR